MTSAEAMAMRLQLRAATSAFHTQLDQALQGLISPKITRLQYRRALERFWGIHAPLETMLNATVRDRAAFHFLMPFSRASCIEADLEFLEATGTLTTAPRMQQMPQVDNTSRLLGVLYVLEGSALGGQVIASHVQRHLGLTATNGASFFAGSSPEATLKRWRAYLEVLEELATDQDATVSAACDTFQLFLHWLAPVFASEGSNGQKGVVHVSG